MQARGAATVLNPHSPVHASPTQTTPFPPSLPPGLLTQAASFTSTGSFRGSDAFSEEELSDSDELRDDTVLPPLSGDPGGSTCMCGWLLKAE